jgi:hypothetical protein
MVGNLCGRECRVGVQWEWSMTIAHTAVSRNSVVSCTGVKDSAVIGRKRLFVMCPV